MVSVQQHWTLNKVSLKTYEHQVPTAAATKSKSSRAPSIEEVEDEDVELQASRPKPRNPKHILESSDDSDDEDAEPNLKSKGKFSTAKWQTLKNRNGQYKTLKKVNLKTYENQQPLPANPNRLVLLQSKR